MDFGNFFLVRVRTEGPAVDDFASQVGVREIDDTPDVIPAGRRVLLRAILDGVLDVPDVQSGAELIAAIRAAILAKQTAERIARGN
jgi:hypothetical protein